MRTRSISSRIGASGKPKPTIFPKGFLANSLARPLPEEMFYYARSDTHYLLYIYDMLRNELTDFHSETYPNEKPIDRVLKKSKEVSLQRYEDSICVAETGAGNRGWFNTLLKSPALYNSEQFAVYKAVHKWRDDVARREDESPPFIMTQQVLSDIARILPTDMKALWSLLESNARGLKARLGELFEVIREARARGANGPTMLEFFRQSSAGTVQTSLGNKPATAPEPQAEPLSIGELKSSRSQLWGSVALNSVQDGSAKARPMDDQELIPLYTFDFGAVREELPTTTPTPPQPLPEQEPEPTHAPADEGFTLRTGRKRKASVPDIPDIPDIPQPAEFSTDSEDSVVSMPDRSPSPPADAPQHEQDAHALRRAKRAKESAKRHLKRAQREAKVLIRQGDPETAKDLVDETRHEYKFAKRVEKRLRQTIQQNPTGESNATTPSANDDEEEQEEEAFDYTKASSVLHPSRSANNDSGTKGPHGKGKRGKQAPVFDPYAQKSGAAPQGARKMNYERKGRTATFKK